MARKWNGNGKDMTQSFTNEAKTAQKLSFFKKLSFFRASRVAVFQMVIGFFFVYSSCMPQAMHKKETLRSAQGDRGGAQGDRGGAQGDRGGAQGDRSGAGDRFSPAEMKIDIDAESELFAHADKMYRLKSYKEALNLYDEYLSKFPQGRSAPEALMREGEIYTAMGNHKTARNVWQHLLDQYPDCSFVSEAGVEMLTSLYREGQYRQVISFADAVSGKMSSPAHIRRLYTVLGDAYIAGGSAINAVHFYGKALKDADAPEKAQILAKLGSASEKLNQEDIVKFMEKTEDSPAKAYLAYRLARIFAEEGKHEEARTLLSKFVSQFPEHEHAQAAKQLLAGYEADAAAADRWTLGCLLPLTGSYKVFGNKAWKGIQLAVQEFGSAEGFPPINIIRKDTASDPDTSAAAVRELAEERVFAIIGPVATAEAAGPEAQRLGIPIITLSQKEGITDIGDYVFRNFLTPKMLAESLASYCVKSLGLRTYAVLYPAEKYGETFMKLFWEEAEAQGGKVVGAESYRPGQTDFTSAIRKLGRGFEALFIPDGPEKVGLILPQLAFYDIRNVRLLGTNLWHSEKLLRSAGRFMENAVFPDIFFADSRLGIVQDFVRDFRLMHGERPDFIEALAFDAAAMLFQLMRRSDIQSKRQLRDELRRLRDFRGVTGMTSFDNSGEAHKKLYLLEVKRGRFTEAE